MQFVVYRLLVIVMIDCTCTFRVALFHFKFKKKKEFKLPTQTNIRHGKYREKCLVCALNFQINKTNSKIKKQQKKITNKQNAIN